MPPQISDDESADSDGPDAIPAKGEIPTSKDEVEDKNDGEDDESDEEEYVVEKILAHDWGDKGAVLYHIKWLGYEDKDDYTWEPLENLTGAKEVLAEYHKKIGEVPQSKSAKKKGPKGGKRTASAAFSESPAVKANGNKRGKKVNDPVGQKELPDGTWEDDITRVSSIIEDSAPLSTEQGEAHKVERKLFGLVEWRDGHKTQHPLDALRRKCPQKLIDYYEQHLVFK